MKALNFILGLIFSTSLFSQVQLNLMGSCQYAGSYEVSWADETFWNGSGGSQTWDTPNMLVTSNAVNANLVLVEGSDPVIYGNCSYDIACSGVGAITNANDLVGNIAVIRRGTCEFSFKAFTAQQAGAIACIIVNYDGNLIEMGAGNFGDSVTIPTVLVDAYTGTIICDAINSGCPQAFIGNITGYYQNNLSSSQSDIYRPAIAIDNINLYNDFDPTNEFYPGIIVKNLGINNQTNAFVMCEIYEIGNNTPIYSEASPYFDILGVTYNNGIPNVNEVWVGFSTPFIIPVDSVRNYKLKYRIITNLANPDNAPYDNTIEFNFSMSDDYFSYAQKDETTNNPIANAGAGPIMQTSTFEWKICTHLYDSTVNLGWGLPIRFVGFDFQCYTDPYTNPSSSIEGAMVQCQIYEWTTSNGIYDITNANFSTDIDSNQLSLISEQGYLYTGNYQDSLINIENFYPVISPNIHYLLCTQIAPFLSPDIKFRVDTKTDYTLTRNGYSNSSANLNVPSITDGKPTTIIFNDETMLVSGIDFNFESSNIIYIPTPKDGLKEVEKNRELVAYPNPAINIITIPFKNITGDATMNIIDAAGKIVSTQFLNLTDGNVTIDVTELESGVYTFKFNYPNGSNSEFKVVIAK